MATMLEWQVSVPVSYLHAAAAMLDGEKLVDAALAEALAGPVTALGEAISASSLPRELFLRHATALATELESKSQLAAVAARKTVGSDRVSEFAVAAISAILSDLETAFCEAVPGALDELAVRGEPLRQQWDTRGPGLLTALGLKTDERLIVSEADVVLVYPVLGGGGAAHLLYNSVRLEAVLADPHPNLKETVRLGWLLAQLNLDLPVHSEAVSGADLDRVGRLAMIPPVLAAATEVEWARCDRETIAEALVAWHVAGGDPERLAATLLDWWDTYRASRPAWSVALAALGQMIGGADRA